MEEHKQAPALVEVRRLLEYAYYHFNRRNIDRLLLVIDPNVKWANGIEGGYVNGQQALSIYWTEQWATIDQQVTPVEYIIDDAGPIKVQVHQLVKDKAGNVLMDRQVTHSYQLQDMKIKSLEITA